MSDMVVYYDDYDLACIDNYKFRRDKKTGYYLSSVKIGERRKRLHVYVWEKVYGKVPDGYAVHHIDEDKRNNEISNLTLLTKSEHAKWHDATMSDERRERRSRNVVENAIPKAVAWHKSEAGIEWHRQNGVKVMRNRKPIAYTCKYCGKEYMSRRIYSEHANMFCSNNCKSAFRRASGADDVVKVCERCGSEYTSNKYQKTRFCRHCKRRKSVA